MDALLDFLMGEPTPYSFARYPLVLAESGFFFCIIRSVTLTLLDMKEFESEIFDIHYYFPGKLTKDWIKCKNLKDDDFIVCGYIRKENHMTSIVLGQLLNRAMIYKGHVTLGVGGQPFQKIKALPILPSPPFQETPPGNENAVWVAPFLVCTVKFMEKTSSGGMRQPVFKGLRDDKRPGDCTVQE